MSFLGKAPWRRLSLGIIIFPETTRKSLTKFMKKITNERRKF